MAKRTVGSKRAERVNDPRKEGAGESQGAMPAPFSRDELRTHILALFFHQMRVIGWMTDASTAWRILGQPAPNDYCLHSPDFDAAEIGQYSQIKHTIFAKTIERMYDYAYFGELDESGESMDDESMYTWTAALLMDIRYSAALHEWGLYGGNGAESAEKCFAVAELANARRVLEGGENFFYFMSSVNDDRIAEDGLLTVRQMALLAGMEEMSIRAAANPKRANALPTISVDRRTRIPVESAKAWLKSRGRYVSITRRWGEAELDLSKRRFLDIPELCSALTARYEALALAESDEQRLVEAFTALGIKITVNPFRSGRRSPEIEAEHLLSDESVERLGEVLQLPEHLLKLRAREARANEELAFVQRELRSLTSHHETASREENRDASN